MISIPIKRSSLRVVIISGILLLGITYAKDVSKDISKDVSNNGVSSPDLDSTVLQKNDAQSLAAPVPSHVDPLLLLPYFY